MWGKTNATIVVIVVVVVVIAIVNIIILAWSRPTCPITKTHLTVLLVLRAALPPITWARVAKGGDDNDVADVVVDVGGDILLTHKETT